MTDRPASQGSPDHTATLTPPQISGEFSKSRNSSLGIFRSFKEALGPGRPDPWLNRKFAVGILLALSVWSFYVIVGRICAPVLQGSSRGFSVATAVGLLVGFVILFLLYIWSYIMMLSNGPGLAKDRVPQTDAPTHSYAPLPPANEPAFIPYPSFPPGPQGSSVNHSAQTANNIDGRQHGGTLVPIPHAMVDHSVPDPSEFAPVIGAIQNAIPTEDQSSSSATLASPHPPPFVKTGARREAPDWRTVERPVPDVQYGPRWCRFCRINKPDRTHHCRHCGTCIMQFDHHCMWVGGCVGWANHKFFMTFCFWAALYCFYILAVLITYLTRVDVDGQVIGLIAVSALFGIFTLMMFIQHIYLILTGKSTVEAYVGSDQSQREAQHLNILFGFWSQHAEKKQVRRKWKEEYGGTSVDDRWKEGSKLDMWKREMGARWYEWICRPLSDGIHYPSNPRFGPNGEWLKKKDWPDGVV